MVRVCHSLDLRVHCSPCGHARRVSVRGALNPDWVRGWPQSRFPYMNPLRPQGPRIRECSTRRFRASVIAPCGAWLLYPKGTAEPGPHHCAPPISRFCARGFVIARRFGRTIRGAPVRVAPIRRFRAWVPALVQEDEDSLPRRAAHVRAAPISRFAWCRVVSQIPRNLRFLLGNFPKSGPPYTSAPISRFCAWGFGFTAGP